MWCDRILRSLDDPKTGGLHTGAAHGVDWVDIDWTQCGRVLKARSRADAEVRVLLSPADRLKHGDVIHEAAGKVIAVNVRPAPMIVATPTLPATLARLALELGNLHHPTQVAGAALVFPEDGPPMEVLERLDIPWRREDRRFAPTHLIAAPAVKMSGPVQIIRSENATET